MESNTKSSTDQPLNDSQTASEYVMHFDLLNLEALVTDHVYGYRFIDSQLKLEADAREVLPFVRPHRPRSCLS